MTPSYYFIVIASSYFSLYGWVFVVLTISTSTVNIVVHNSK